MKPPLLLLLFCLFLSSCTGAIVGSEIGYLHPKGIQTDAWSQAYLVYGLSGYLRWIVWDNVVWDGNITTPPGTPAYYTVDGITRCALNQMKHDIAGVSRYGYYGNEVLWVKLGYTPDRPSLDPMFGIYRLKAWDEVNKEWFEAARFLVGYSSGGWWSTGKYIVDEWAWVLPTYNASNYLPSNVVSTFSNVHATRTALRGGGRDLVVTEDVTLKYKGPETVYNAAGKDFYQTVLWLEGSKESRVLAYYVPKGKDRGLQIAIRNIYEAAGSWRVVPAVPEEDAGIWCDLVLASGSWRGSQAEAYEGMGDTSVQNSFFLASGVRGSGGGADYVYLIHHLQDIPETHTDAYNVETTGAGWVGIHPVYGFQPWGWLGIPKGIPIIGGWGFYLFKKKTLVPIAVDYGDPGMQEYQQGYVVFREPTQIDGFENCWSSAVAVGTVSNAIAWIYCDANRYPVVKTYRPYFTEGLKADPYAWKQDDWAEEWGWRTYDLAPFLGIFKSVRNVAIAVDDTYGSPHIAMTVQDGNDNIDIWYGFLDSGGWNVTKKVDDWCKVDEDRGIALALLRTDKVDMGGLAFVPHAKQLSSGGYLAYTYNDTAVFPFEYGTVPVNITWPGVINQYEIFEVATGGSDLFEYYEMKFYFNGDTLPVYEKTVPVHAVHKRASLMLWHSGNYTVELWGGAAGSSRYRRLARDSIMVNAQPKACRIFFDWGYRWHDMLNFSLYQKGFGWEGAAWEVVICATGYDLPNDPLSVLWYEYDEKGQVYGGGGKKGVNVTLAMVPDGNWVTFQLGTPSSFPLEFGVDYVAFVRPVNTTAGNLSWRNWVSEVAAFIRFGLYASDPSGTISIVPGGGVYSETQILTFNCVLYGIAPGSGFVHGEARLDITDLRGRRTPLTISVSLDDDGVGWVKTSISPAGYYSAKLYAYYIGGSYAASVLAAPNLYMISSTEFRITSNSLWGDVFVDMYDRFGEERVTWLISAIAVLGIGAFIGAGTRDGNLAGGFVILAVIIFAAEAWLPGWILIMLTFAATYFCLRFLRSMYSLAEY